MNILPISNQKQSNIVFTGLWGTTSTQTSGINRGSCTSVFLNYYPFCNETMKDIKDIVDKNTSYWMQGSNEKPIYYYSNVIVGKSLPFSQSEYDLYKSSQASKKLKYKIGKSLDDARLNTYINNKFEYYFLKYTRLINKILKKI